MASIQARRPLASRATASGKQGQRGSQAGPTGSQAGSSGSQAGQADATHDPPGSPPPSPPRRRPGKNKREQQARLDRPAPLPPLPKDAAGIEGWLVALGRSALASGFTLRTGAQEDLDAFAAILARSHKHAALLRDRGITAVVLAGAARLEARLRATLAALGGTEADGPGGLDLAPAIDLVMRCRDSLNRLLPGAGNAPARRRFGIHLRIHPRSARSVRDACAAMASGRTRASHDPASLLLTDADVAALRGHAAAIDAALAARSDRERGRSASVTTRDVEHAGLEKFYDWYAAVISMALPTGQERKEALEEVPRREERRLSKHHNPDATLHARAVAKIPASS